jgi:hypothetical protein
MFVRLCLLFVGFILFGVFLNVFLIPLAFLLGGIVPHEALMFVAGVGSAVVTIWILGAAFRSVAETERKDEERRQKKAAAKEQAAAKPDPTT